MARAAGLEIRRTVAAARALPALIVMPPVIVGLWIGLKLGHRLDKELFRRLTYGLLIVSRSSRFSARWWPSAVAAIIAELIAAAICRSRLRLLTPDPLTTDPPPCTSPPPTATTRCPTTAAARSGLKLPAVSLGLWHNFGGVDAYETGRAIVRRAFDRGVTHFDLANNYGPPPGSAEENFGRMLRDDLAPYRDELIISTKAGYLMWPGPYGEWGSRKYLLASLDQSLQADGPRLRRHLLLAPPRPRHAARRNPRRRRHRRAAGQGAVRRHLELQRRADPRGLPHPRASSAARCLIHQPKYSMFERWVEDGLLDVLGEEGVGCIPFSPLAQGLLTDRYLARHPRRQPRRQAARLPQAASKSRPSAIAKARRLNEIAQRRGQSLAQMALAWVLRDPRITTVLIGASSVAQLDQNLACLDNREFAAEELAEIEKILA